MSTQERSDQGVTMSQQTANAWIAAGPLAMQSRLTEQQRAWVIAHATTKGA